jgi:hypothetical protein
MENISWLNIGVQVATISLAFLTGIYVLLTRQLVKRQVDPYIVVFVHHDNTRPTILQLVIRNIGAGVAKNIQFKIAKQLPSRAFGLDPNTAQDAQTMSDGALLAGIPALVPGEDRRIDWGQYGGLVKAIGDNQIEIEASFLTDDSRKLNTKSIVEIMSFKGTNASKHEPYKDIVDELRKINSSLHGLGSKSNTLKLKIDN